MIVLTKLSYNGGTGSVTSRLMSHRSGGTTMTTPKKNVAQDLTGMVFGRLTGSH